MAFLTALAAGVFYGMTFVPVIRMIDNPDLWVISYPLEIIFFFIQVSGISDRRNRLCLLALFRNFPHLYCALRCVFYLQVSLICRGKVLNFAFLHLFPVQFLFSRKNQLRTLSKPLFFAGRTSRTRRRPFSCPEWPPVVCGPSPRPRSSSPTRTCPRRSRSRSSPKCPDASPPPGPSSTTKRSVAVGTSSFSAPPCPLPSPEPSSSDSPRLSSYNLLLSVSSEVPFYQLFCDFSRFYQFLWLDFSKIQTGFQFSQISQFKIHLYFRSCLIRQISDYWV